MSLKYDYFSDHKMASSHKVIKDINSLSAENWMGAASASENEELLAALREARKIEKDDASFNQMETDEAVKNLTKITQQFQKVPASVTPLNSPEKQSVNSNTQSGKAQTGGSVVKNKNTGRPRYQVCSTKRIKMISEKIKPFEGDKDGIVTIKIRATQFVMLRQLLESACDIFGQASSCNLSVLEPLNPAIAHLMATKDEIKRDNLQEDKILSVSQSTMHQGSQTNSNMASVHENPSTVQQPAMQPEKEKHPFVPPTSAVPQGPPAPSVPVFNNSQPGLEYSQEASSPAQEPVFPPHHHTWSSGPSGPSRGRGSRGQRHNPYEHQDRNTLIQHQVWLRQKLRETDPTRRGNRGGWRGRGSNWY